MADSPLSLRSHVTAADEPSTDQTRLRWLREDLTSCLGEISAILHRASGNVDPPPPAHIDIEVPEADPHELQPREAGSRVDSPAMITWTWPDGAAVSYDWRSRSIQWRPPP
jgi:hypothetical protein